MSHVVGYDEDAKRANHQQQRSMNKRKKSRQQEVECWPHKSTNVLHHHRHNLFYCFGSFLVSMLNAFLLLSFYFSSDAPVFFSPSFLLSIYFDNVFCLQLESALSCFTTFTLISTIHSHYSYHISRRKHRRTHIDNHTIIWATCNFSERFLQYLFVNFCVQIVFYRVSVIIVFFFFIFRFSFIYSFVFVVFAIVSTIFAI